MVVNLKHSILFLLVWTTCIIGHSQGHLHSEVQIDRAKVYVGEPVEVSIGIYTSTWFTKGVNFGNIQVNGAFSVYFRSVSSSKKINGKNYAGVVAIYNVFPYDDKDLEFPSLEVTVETPNEGESKGVKRVIKTRSRKIAVKPVPKKYNRDEWLVASGVNVNESWQGDLNTVKVGDVIQRRIYRKAYRTVSELIPPIHWDSVAGVSIYPTRGEINSEKSKTSISASRSDGVRYLFEKEGSILLPEITVVWWNPRQNKLFKRTLESKTIEVLPNPNLGMLESVRDSLKVSEQHLTETAEKNDIQTIFGLSLREFFTYLFIILILFYAFFKFLKWLLINKGLLARWRKNKTAYLASEKYYFKLFLKEVAKSKNRTALNSLYHWIDRLDLKEPTLQYFADNFGSKEFAQDIGQLGKANDFDSKSQLHAIKKARQNYLTHKNKSQLNNTSDWINP